MKKKVVFISEYLNPPYDEGIKKTVYQLYKLLNDHYDLQVICRYGPTNLENVKCCKTNQLFFSREVKSIITSFRPDAILYFPFASSTFAGFLRNFNLARYYSSANNLMIALQPKPLKNWQKHLLKYFKPKIVLTPSPLLKERLDALGVKNKLLPLFTDLTIFKPIEIFEQKMELRKKYKIPLDSFVISHMGHLNKGRNLECLIPLQKEGHQVVVVGSSSTPEDAKGPDSIKIELKIAGITIIDEFIEKIEEIYQLSDLYVFPVTAPNSSVGLPLSILEARACGIPVLTTKFGSIKKYLAGDNGAIYYATPTEFPEIVKNIRESRKLTFQETNVRKLNNEFVNTIIASIETRNSN